MAHTCKCGCGWPVFSHGYAKFCQNKRTDDKKPKKAPAHTKRERVRDFDFGFENQTDLFQWLWQDAQNEKGEVFCPYTGEKLNRFYNTEMWFSCFMHLLNKKNWIYFKLNPKNIRIGFPSFHKIVDQGTSLDRANHPEWKFELWNREVEEMKIQYALFKKQNLLA